MNTLGQLLERNARCYPIREALICAGKRHTYRSYFETALRLADALHARGLQRQDRVAILSMNNAEYMELLAAGDVAGYIVTAINFRLAAPEIEWLLMDSSPKVLVFEAQYLPVVAALKERLAGLSTFVVIDDGTPVVLPPWATPWQTLMQSGSSDGPPFRSHASDYGPLVYTSGTTGRPKGALRAQWRWVRTADLGAANSEFDSDTRILLTTPAFHVGVIGYAAQAYWRAGAIVLHRSFDAQQVLDAIENERITFTFVVAAMLQALLDAPGATNRNLSSLKNVVAAGAPVPVPLLQRAVERMGPVFSVQYGATETAGTTLFRRDVNPFGDAHELKRLASVGHTNPHNRLKVLDDAGLECPVGVAGEVCIQSEDRFDAYWNNTAATLEALRDGWYHTGDVGYLDGEGYLFLVDRKKDMIISGGENIYSREVENAVLSHPATQDCAVIGVPDPKWGEAVCVVLVCKPGMTLQLEDLLMHCKTQIASYKCPRRLEIVNELPRVASGKVNKVALRARYASIKPKEDRDV
jgi:acyl-CoA synthetase (AMP-forming)/AMP-acid ligase II